MKRIGLTLALAVLGATHGAAQAKTPARTYDLLGVKHEAKFELAGGKAAWLEGGTPVLLLKRRERKSLVMVPGVAGYAVGLVFTNSLEPVRGQRPGWGSALDARLPRGVSTPVENARTVRDVLSAGLVRRMKSWGHTDIVAVPGDRKPRIRLTESEALYVLGTLSFNDEREGDRFDYAYVFFHGATGYVKLEHLEELQPLSGKELLHARDPASMQLAAAVVQREGLLLYGGKGEAVVALPQFGKLKVVRETWDRLYVYAEGHCGGVRGVLSRDGLKFQANRWSRYSAFNVDASYFEAPSGLLGKEVVVRRKTPTGAGLVAPLKGTVPTPQPTEAAYPVVQEFVRGKIGALLADAPTRVLPAGTVVWRHAQVEGSAKESDLFTLRVDVEAKVIGESSTWSNRLYVYFKGATGYVDVK